MPIKRYSFTYFSKFLQICLVVLLQSCMSEIKPILQNAANAVGSGGYAGCSKATPVSTSSIRVSFTFPNNATEVAIYRDGFQVLSTRNPSNSSLLDIGLLEGATYNYKCVANINDKFDSGSSTIDATTLIIHKPVFTGIDSATPIIGDPTKVTIAWPIISSGAVAKTYKIYSKINAVIDFTLDTPRLIVKADDGVNSIDMTGLADDTTYHFAVKACAANGLCDDNIKEITMTSANGGAPAQPIISVAYDSGNAIISAPWDESHGGVNIRKLYRSLTSGGAKTSITTLTNTPENPSILITDSGPFSGGTSYYYTLVDYDSHGNASISSSEARLDVGDIIPPIFSGIISASLPGPGGLTPSSHEEDTVHLTWSPQPAEPTPGVNPGARYLYIYQALGNVNACSTAVAPLPSTILTNDGTIASDGTNNYYDVTGLSPRTTYSFCMKAVDLAKNVNSISYSQKTISTKDTTSPVFTGISTLSFGTGSINLSWGNSLSLDLSKYIVTLKNNGPVSAVSTSSFTITAPATTLTINKGGSFTFADGDSITASVEACDNAYSTYTSKPNGNCTDTLSAFASLTYNVPDRTAPYMPVSGMSISATAAGTGGIEVGWLNIASLTTVQKQDFMGFNIYNVNYSGPTTFTLDYLGTASCSSPGVCPTSKVFTAADLPNKLHHKYNILVTAFDAASPTPNETSKDPSVVVAASFTTTDTTPPVLSGSFSVVDPSHINWSNATDDQDASLDYSQNNNIKYYVYRSGSGLTPGPAFSTSTTLNIPDNSITGATLISSIYGITANTFAEPTTLTQGATYNYFYCAVDSSLNRSCSASIAVIYPDTTAPAMSSLAIADIVGAPTWTFKVWTVNGTVDPISDVVFQAYYCKDNNSSISINSISSTTGPALQACSNYTPGTANTGWVTMSLYNPTPANAIYPYSGGPTTTSSNVTFTPVTLELAPSPYPYGPLNLANGIDNKLEYVHVWVQAKDKYNNASTATIDHQIRKPTLTPTNLTYSGVLNANGNPTISLTAQSSDWVTLYKDSSCSIATGSGGVTVGVAGQPVTVTLDPGITAGGRYQLYARANRSVTGNSDCSATYVDYVVCPTGYISVPASATQGTNAFCVMKYESKCSGISCPVCNWAGCTTVTPAATVAVAASTTSGYPWTNISETNAKTACALNGANYDLISNPEWMAIAQNIENVDSNWSNGVVGSGTLPRGNSTSTPNGSIGATVDTSPYAGTGGSSIEKRTNTLSNGNIIWDLAGNVWEWVDWSFTTGLQAPQASTCTTSNTWQEFKDVAALTNCTNLPLTSYSPTDTSLNATSAGVGQFYGGAGASLVRGGRYNGQAASGIFSFSLASLPTDAPATIGFRCVYRP